MKKPQNRYEIDVEFEVISIYVNARNGREAKKKALAKLARKNPVKFIKRDWRTHRINGVTIN